MARKKVSAQRGSMSQAAKRLLKEKKRQERRGNYGKDEASPPTVGRGFWIAIIATLSVAVIFALVVFAIVGR